MLANAGIRFSSDFGCWRMWASVFRPISDADEREHPFFVRFRMLTNAGIRFSSDFRMLTNAGIRFSLDLGFFSFFLPLLEQYLIYFIPLPAKDWCYDSESTEE